MLPFTKKGNDSITMEYTEMEKRPYYYGTEGVLFIDFNYLLLFLQNECRNASVTLNRGRREYKASERI